MTKPRNSALQFVRYVFVGGFAALIDTSTLYVLYKHFELNHYFAAALGFLFGLIVNYAMSILWVFESTGRIKEELALFTLVGLGGLAWTELILWVLVDAAQAPVMFAKAVALFLVLIWNFGMRKKFVFVDA